MIVFSHKKNIMELSSFSDTVYLSFDVARFCNSEIFKEKQLLKFEGSCYNFRGLINISYTTLTNILKIWLGKGRRVR